MAIRTVRVYLESDAGTLPGALSGPEEAFAHDLAHANGGVTRELLAELRVEDGGRKSLPRIEGFRRGREILATRGLEYDGDECRFYRGTAVLDGTRLRVEVE